MTGDEDLPAGQCVCGRDLPEHALSDWACSEPCQSAWLMHHTNPTYPHPREIRAAAEARLARGPTPVPDPGGLMTTTRPGMIPDGTEITVDGNPFVRVGSHWRPAGMWTPDPDQPAGIVRYRRWCPNCQDRQGSLIHPDDDRQECASCGFRWPGRPLLGEVESRGAPWPGIRLRLFDGHRSAVAMLPDHAVQQAGDQLAEMSQRAWLRLERRLCGGYADADQPTEQQQRRALRQLRRAWHPCTDRA